MQHLDSFTVFTLFVTGCSLLILFAGVYFPWQAFQKSNQALIEQQGDAYRTMMIHMSRLVMALAFSFTLGSLASSARLVVTLLESTGGYARTY